MPHDHLLVRLFMLVNDVRDISTQVFSHGLEYKKYSKLVSNNPKFEELTIKYINDFRDVDFENKEVGKFKAKKIYFLRIVRRKGEKESDEEHGFINILKREISLPADMINLFVFYVLDLKLKNLIIKTEKDDGTSKIIKSLKYYFRLNNH